MIVAYPFLSLQRPVQQRPVFFMPFEIQICKPIPDDAQDIAEAHVCAWQQGYRSILPDRVLDSLSIETKAEVWYRQLNGELPFFEEMYVAKLMGKVLGWVTGGPTRDRKIDPTLYQEIYALYVNPKYWGKGVGTKLMQHMLGMLDTSGWPYTHLWVFKKNLRAQRFYQKFNFIHDGREKPFCIQSAAAPQICMVRNVPIA